MAHPLLKQYGPQGDLFSDSTERKALNREKLGVIAGFLTGVLVVVGIVDPLLESAGMGATWAHFVSAALIGICTLAGHSLGNAGAPDDQA